MCFLLFCFCISSIDIFAQQTYAVKGTVTDRKSRQKLSYVNVKIWNTQRGAATDDNGNYEIGELPPGLYRIQVSSIGYNSYISPEFKLSAHDYRLNVELDENGVVLQEVSVVSSPFRRVSESPIALKIIGLQEIEKSPGANRDISRVVNSFPGVASSAGGGYRNDLLVRGGGPSENRFFLDGVEIPNINHFSTQGASGGPVGIIDADFIREVEFYTGAFPANRGNALSSVLDFKLKDGNTDRNTYKATVGASEVALTSSGHFGSKTTYLVSVRQSYLQLLFRVLGLPFLPTFTDAQFKVKTRFSYQHELTFLGLGAIDNMRLNKNTDAADESNQYILSYLPTIKQHTYTLGAVYKHYAGNHVQTVVLSHSFLDNKNIKYKDNDESSADNLTLRYHSGERESRLRFENNSRFDQFKINAGANLDYAVYTNNTMQRIFMSTPKEIRYETDLNLVKWGIFGSAAYESTDGKWTAAFGFRLDANNYSDQMNNPFKQFSPRLSLSYNLFKDFYVNGNIGRYYQLPAYTTLGLKDSSGTYVNRNLGLKYVRSDQAVLGLEYRWNSVARFTVEGFYKKYANGEFSIADSIPLACKGVDYGVTGNEAVVSDVSGRSYGVEFMARWFGRGRFNLITSYTFFRSEFLNKMTGRYISSAWDNRHLLTVSGTYKLPRNWDVGLKFRAMGGTPYTPYDTDKSSLVEAWDVSGRPYYDYTLYNTLRLKTFTQLDVRIDKSFYFKGVMLGFYIDIQNILNTKYANPPVYVSTGIVDESTSGLPPGEQRYKMKYISQESGVVLPTLGITVEF